MRKPSNGVLLLIIGVVFAAVFFTRDGILNEPAPAFSLPDVAGGKIDLASYRGRPVLLAFWTTSCPICRSELPLLSELAPELRGKGIEVLAIELGGPEGVADYLRDYRIRLRTLTDSEGTVGRAYGVDTVPRLVMIGPDGKVKHANTGMTTESTLRDWAESVTGS